MSEDFGMSESERSWTLELPRGWTASQDDSVVTLVRPRGKGKVRIQLTIRDQGRFTDDDLRAAAGADLGRNATVKKARCGDFSGLRHEHQDRGRHLRDWWLRAADLLLHVRYECSLADRGREDEAVDAILATLALDPPEN
jgi:hypothetical protein